MRQVALNKSMIAWAAAALLATAPVSEAAVMVFTGSGTGEGKTVSAKAQITITSGTATIVLENLTPFTHSAGQLLTGLEFTITDATGSATLTAATTPHGRTVYGDGSFTDTPGPVNLLTAKSGGATWGLADATNDTFRLTFNPDAKYGILGTPEGDGDYSQANNSIKNNNGHNPMSALSATFTLTIPGLTDSSTVSSVSFLFGTSFATNIPGEPETPEDPNEPGEPGEPGDPPTMLPEPGTFALVGLACVCLHGSRRFGRTRELN